MARCVMRAWKSDEEFKMENYKVVILAAGIGSRMGDFTKTFNKALVPIHGKPAVCHIIEKFSPNVEIVVAVGYKKETVIEYLRYAYPERKITFVDVDKYTGPGTGPGYSLLQCKNHLQCPFIFLSVDTIVRESIPVPNNNWFGVAEVLHTERFCSASLENKTNKVVRIDDKVASDNKHAFIGLAGVNDYEFFWDNLSANKNSIAGEIQVSNGFSALMQKNMIGKIFTWFDTGTEKSYNHALSNYPDGEGYDGE